MQKVDVRKLWPHLYSAPTGEFVSIDVPAMRYVMVDGHGDPNRAPAYQTALQWLYSVSYAMKFAAKSELGRDYVAPPLEGLWTADDPADFADRRKDRWRWTMMILAPDFLEPTMFASALEKARKKLGDPPPSLRLEALNEGRCLQTLHIGPYDAEGPILKKLHCELMPAERLTFSGPHHEIYLSDPRRISPDKLKTLLRQPVKPLAATNKSTPKT